MGSRRDAALFIVAAALSYFAAGIALLYLNFYFRSLGLDDRAIGALNGAPAIGLALAAVPTFAVADRFPRKYVLLGGGALTLLGTVGVIASSELAMLLAFATLFGAGALVTNAAGIALLAEVTSGPARTRTFGVWFAASSIAAFVAYAAGGALAAPTAALLGTTIDDVLTFRALLALAAVIGATSGIPILLLASRERPRHVDAPRQWTTLARFATVNALFGFGAGSFLPFVNLFFAERFGSSIVEVGVLIGAINVGGAVGAIVHTRLAPRLGDVRGLVSVWSVSLPFALLAALSPVAYVAAAGLLVRGILMYASAPTMDSFTISSLRPRERSGGQVIVSTTWAIAHGAGAFVSGNVRAVLGDGGFTANLLTLVVCYVLAIATFVVFFRGRAPSGDDATH